MNDQLTATTSSIVNDFSVQTPWPWTSALPFMAPALGLIGGGARFAQTGEQQFYVSFIAIIWVIGVVIAAHMSRKEVTLSPSGLVIRRSTREDTKEFSELTIRGGAVCDKNGPLIGTLRCPVTISSADYEALLEELAGSVLKSRFPWDPDSVLYCPRCGQRFAKSAKSCSRCASALYAIPSLSWETLMEEASPYYHNGQFDRAVDLTLRALEDIEKDVGSNHPDVGVTLSNLAVLYILQERYAEAEPLCIRSLAVCERCFGPDHEMVATCLEIFAMLYQATDREEKATVLEQRAERIRNPEKPIS